jgi:hypothetical protein
MGVVQGNVASSGAPISCQIAWHAEPNFLSMAAEVRKVAAHQGLASNSIDAQRKARAVVIYV